MRAERPPAALGVKAGRRPSRSDARVPSSLEAGYGCRWQREHEVELSKAEYVAVGRPLLKRRAKRSRSGRTRMPNGLNGLWVLSEDGIDTGVRLVRWAGGLMPPEKRLHDPGRSRERASFESRFARAQVSGVRLGSGGNRSASGKNSSSDALG